MTSWAKDPIDVAQDLAQACEIHGVDAVVGEGDNVNAASGKIQSARAHFQKLNTRKALASNLHHSGAIVDPAVISAEGQDERNGSATADAISKNGTLLYGGSYELKGSLFAWLASRLPDYQHPWG